MFTNAVVPVGAVPVIPPHQGAGDSSQQQGIPRSAFSRVLVLSYGLPESQNFPFPPHISITFQVFVSKMTCTTLHSLQ